MVVDLREQRNCRVYSRPQGAGVLRQNDGDHVMRELTLNEIEQVDGANVSTSTVLGVGAAITGVGAVVLTIAAVGVAAPILAPAAAVYGATAAVMGLGAAVAALAEP